MQGKTIRKLRGWHYKVGLIFGINMIIFSLTGAILVFHEELEDLLVGHKPKVVSQQLGKEQAQQTPISLR
ncbi:MAG: PepSY-associated TM helix domain-containing protein [Spirochaetota bacterium]